MDWNHVKTVVDFVPETEGKPMNGDIDLARSLAAQLQGRHPRVPVPQLRLLLLRMARKLELLADFEKATEVRASACHRLRGPHTFEMEVIMSGDEVFSRTFDAELHSVRAARAG